MDLQYENSRKMYKLFLLVLSSTLIHAQLEMFEGSACNLHTGKMGVCKKSENCRWLIQNLEKKKMKYTDIKRCMFSENGEDIVCCGDERPNSIPDNREPCKYGYVFDGIDCTKVPETIYRDPIIDNVEPDQNFKKREKVIAACKKYSSIATVYFPSSIVNGRPAGLTEFPHVVALGYPNDKNSFDFDCGGSLIADQWIVTAAHCIKDRHKPTIIRMGKIYLHNDEDGVEAIDRSISRIIRHPEYSYSRKKNDIALIEFDGFVEFSDVVRPACIRTNTADLSTTQELMIAGWGSIEAGRANRSELLLKANVTTVPINECIRALLEYTRGTTQQSIKALNETQMCALNLLEMSDACQGDSGGPIFLYDTFTGVSTIVGIVSYGISCGTALPSVYTRIASYIDWIERIVWP